MKKNKIIVLLIILILSNKCLPVLAEPSGNDDEAISDNESLKYELQLKIQNLREEIQMLDSEIVTLMVEAEELELEIIDIEDKIEKNKNYIEECEEKIEKQSELLDLRVRGLYKEGNFSGVPNILASIVSVDSLKELFEKIEKINVLTSTDKKLIEKNQELKNELENILAENEKAEQELIASKEILDRNLEDIEEKKAVVLNKLDVALEQERLRQEEEERRRQEEEERRRQEEEEKRQEELNNSLNEDVDNSDNDDDGYTEDIEYDKEENGSELANLIIDEAMKYLGVPYVWGGESLEEGGFDCSGLVQYCYGKYGVNLPRVSQDQQNAGTKISLDSLQPGDLIFWGSPAWHVAIYIGNGMYIHAPQTGDVVRIAYIDYSRLSSAARVL